MPLYEYQCKKCKHRFEKIQQYSDAEVKKCPECGGKVEKMVSAAAVQFKGSGWYVTDYAKSGSSSAKSGEGEGPSSGGEKTASDGAAAKSEGPPAPASEGKSKPTEEKKSKAESDAGKKHKK